MPFQHQSTNGQPLDFREFDFYSSWYYEVGGLYIFAKRDPITTKWIFLYIGKTDSFGRRMNEQQRDKWPDAVNLGAHVVLAVVIPLEQDRISLEKELIHLYRPRLNTINNPSKPQQPRLGLSNRVSRTNPTSAPQLGLLGAYINRK
ncbi:MAG: GIY-YIG nuclease family protein [Methylobacter sp.]